MEYSTKNKIIYQLIDAIHYLHSKDIIHGDLKCENIIFDPWSENISILDIRLLD